MKTRFKGSAIHNLRITGNNDEGEGLIVPSSILDKANILEGQEVIITKIGAGNWKNRIKTFVISGCNNGEVIVCGSLSKFLDINDLTCLIGEIYLTDEQLFDYHNDKLPIFDLGFDPNANINNETSVLDLQFYTKTEKDIKTDCERFYIAEQLRKDLVRVFASSVILDLCINSTHPDCLQGSAELPASVMNAGSIERYKSVSVYNSSVGGLAETYAVPMPEGIVMTTGAMASFACIGQKVNVVSYILDTHPQGITWTKTNGKELISK